METNIEKATHVFIEWLKDCDVDNLCAVFDYAFGTTSEYDAEEDILTIQPGDGYGGILDEFRRR
jgi:hypothetical protein